MRIEPCLGYKGGGGATHRCTRILCGGDEMATLGTLLQSHSHAINTAVSHEIPKRRGLSHAPRQEHFALVRVLLPSPRQGLSS